MHRGAISVLIPFLATKMIGLCYFGDITEVLFLPRLMALFGKPSTEEPMQLWLSKRFLMRFKIPLMPR